MSFVRSTIFNICFTAWAFIAACLFSPLFLFSEKTAIKAGKPWAWGALWLARVILGITYEVRGREHIVQSGVIYASKHQSAWDTLVFLVLLERPCYVLKRELLRIPFWGWYLWRMGMIAIDRSGKASTMKKLIRDAKEKIARGRPIVIYPEGTRTKPGATPDYHPGIVALYSQLDVPVVPVALNSGLFWGKDAFLKKPGTITIVFLPPMAPGKPKPVFMRELQTVIEEETQKLIGA